MNSEGKLKFLRTIAAKEKEIKRLATKVDAQANALAIVRSKLAGQNTEMMSLETTLQQVRQLPRVAEKVHVSTCSPKMLDEFREIKTRQNADKIEGHYQHLHKCIACDLHFAALSWWETSLISRCPQCGGSDVVQLCRWESEKEIFELNSLS